MRPRIDNPTSRPGLNRAMSDIEEYAHQLGLERSLLELIKLRPSLINARYCVVIHARAARLLGETERRLRAVSLWRKAPFFTERERAALAWTEA